MLIISLLLMYMAIYKKYEPLLLLPIAFGMFLTNFPLSNLMADGESPGLLYILYQGVRLNIYPPLIFIGVGAMTDFGPLIANPKTMFLGAAAQFGIFFTLIGSIFLGFDIKEAAAIGIIGGADGPTAIFLTNALAPHLIGSIAIAAYSYMALVPIIQPPVIKLLTSKEERKIKMQELREVSKQERIVFPLTVALICGFIIPQSLPLVGCLMFGNLLKESGVTQRLANTAENQLNNIVVIFLGLSVGATATAKGFLNIDTLKIILLGLVAFTVGTAFGVIMGKIMCKLTKGQINPIIGSAGVSAVPMAARVSQQVGQKANPENYLLMHAMGPNVAGVIGSAVAAGILLSLLG
ncbi:sodium ion-translocating decarboxylase subunit beta [Alkalicella caledoniensis]|uniref:Sodium ion-translocating decarboxylase subunit beta n=2 Tax=Alkalicella caledoniensis TaxID=2731377 RepID=A0A7G9WD34_ALKCA|nr:sodium ion-translocating decarboxylase subunit beta [Alkalicella caledoniensis]